MDKYEYRIRTDEIKALIAQGNYAQAAEIADMIDWRLVKSVMMLCMISDLYKINRRYEDARNVLLLAYDRHPGGRSICYSLCELSIKLGEFVQAIEYYKEFVQAAPRDWERYVLQYKLYEAQDVSLEERIAVLEELKKREYREKWVYELAYLYHRVGQATKCVEVCDELILWFGEGKYVTKAMELKMLHEPLTPQQQSKYDYQMRKNAEPELAEEEAAGSGEEGQEELPEETEETWQEERPEEEAPENGGDDYPQEDFQGEVPEEGFYEDQPGEDSGEISEEEPVEDTGSGELSTNAPTQIYGKDHAKQVEEGLEKKAGQETPDDEMDIQVKTMDVSPYNTINLQKELAEGLREVLAQEEMAQKEAALKAEQEAAAQAGEEAVSEETVSEEETEGYEDSYEEDSYEETDEDGQEYTGEEELTDENGADGQEDTWEEEPADESGAEDQGYDGIEESPDGSGTDGQEDTWEEEPADESGAEDQGYDEIEESPDGSVTDGQEDTWEEEPADESGTEDQGYDGIEESPDGSVTDGQEDAGEEEAADESDAEDQGYAGIEEPAAESGAEDQEDAGIEETTDESGDDSLEYAGIEEPTEGTGGDGQEYAGSGQKERGRRNKKNTGSGEDRRTSADWKRIENEPAEKTQDEDPYNRALQGAEDLLRQAEGSLPEGLAEVLSMEPDGQIRMVVPESKKLEKQLTGQLRIDEVLAEWERLQGQEKEAIVDLDELAKDGKLTEGELPEEQPAEEQASEGQSAGKQGAEAQSAEKQGAESQSAGKQGAEAQSAEKQGTESQSAGKQGAEAQSAEKQDTESQSAEKQDTKAQPAEKQPAEAEAKAADGSGKGAKSDKAPAAVVRDQVQVRSMTREEKELFGSFLQNKSDRDMLVKALDTVSLAAYTGNVVVTGDEGLDTFSLARNVVKYMQMSDTNFSGKTAKISGESLNNEVVSAIIERLRNGALIVQNAAGMNQETAANLYKSLQQESLGIVVVLVDTKRAIHKFFGQNEKLETCFNARIDLEALDDEALVTFGKKYAREMEYSIDEMGVLALHTRVHDMQSSDHAVTIMDVKTIVDEAIRRANRKTIKHFLDVLLGKRYDDDDMIILREKDFAL